MGKNFKIILTIGVVIIGLILIGLAFILIQFILNSSPAQNDQNDPVTENPDNNNNGEIDIDPVQTQNYKYAVITNDDTIKLFEENGKELVVDLNKNEWNNIQVSSEYDLLSLKGKNNGVENIYIYNIEEKDKKWITNYSSQDLEGVRNYKLNENTLYFMQGNGINSWFHKIEISTKQEILKLKNIDGTIRDIFSENAIIEQNKVFYFLKLPNSDLTKVSINDVNPTVILDIQKIDEESYLLYFTGVAGYRYQILNFKNTQTENLTLDIAFIPICISDNYVYGYRQDDTLKSLNIYKYNFETKKFSELGEVSLFNKSFLTEQFSCTSENVLFPLRSQNEIEWISIIENEFKQVSFLKNSKEVKLIK